MQPIYTAENCRPAYQLDWSLALFWREPPGDDAWVPELRGLCEPDGIRILRHEFTAPNVSRLLVSVRPPVVPLDIVQRIKGRTQRLVRDRFPKAFRGNYSLRSVGSTRREKLDAYLAGQLGHHPLADPRTTEQLARFQIHDPSVDLSAPSRNTHALYWYNLHLAFVNRDRGRDTSEATLASIRQMLLSASAKKGHGLSRAALLADHIHLTLRCSLAESAEGVALGYMNNLAYALGMRAAFDFSYFAGTFGDYDLGAIPRSGEPLAPPG